jgi:hypothetical protein
MVKLISLVPFYLTKPQTKPTEIINIAIPNISKVAPKQ